jgi:glycosyltransferase involved in cell wall biosynthesis
MSESPARAAIRFELDGYDMARPKVMGRQSAGSGFLRAALKARGDAPVAGYGPSADTGAVFETLARSLDPAAQTEWIRSDQLDRFSTIGACYRPDPVLGPEARLRLRAGPARYSLCGVTHTLSTGGIADSIADYLAGPLMPWDALVCTSHAALSVVNSILEEQGAYLTWRFGQTPSASTPQLPVIPLGVHCDDFVFTGDHRRKAREALALADDEVTVLYAGRLSVVDKAHPFPLYHALQAAAQRTGKKAVLLLAGQFLNAFPQHVYEVRLAALYPGVRAVLIDGAQREAYRDAWAAADIFVSTADNIQETFGLTPVEAMAAGLPAVISDWNGYRGTVRDGVDGFRIDTWAPLPGTGESLGLAYDSEVINVGRYAWAATLVTAVDLAQMTDRIASLLSDHDLRRKMGEAGRRRAREIFDWAVVYPQYQALWDELGDRRRAVQQEPDLLAKVLAAPRAASRLDPFRTFASYPTAHVTSRTRLLPEPGADVARYRALIAMFPQAGLSEGHVAALLARLDSGGLSVGEAALLLNSPLGVAVRLAATLAKMGLLHLAPAG